MFKKKTRLCFKDSPPQDSAFHDHPIFHGIPYLAPRDGVQPILLEELRRIEEQVRLVNKSQKHKFGANVGSNVGISIVDDGIYSNKSKASLGPSIFRRSSKEDLTFARELCNALGIFLVKHMEIRLGTSASFLLRPNSANRRMNDGLSLDFHCLGCDVADRKAER
jgi:hypothetical protein